MNKSWLWFFEGKFNAFIINRGGMTENEGERDAKKVSG